MTTEFVKDELHRFVSNPKSGAIAFVGKWGVGKTYTWNKWLLEFKKNIALEQYAYVSLFGVSSIDTLKLAITQSIIPTNFAGGEVDKNSIWASKSKNIGWLTRQLASIAPALPVAKDLKEIINSASFNFANKSLICIDDFERKSKDLDTLDVLGLVSLLKDQMKCQVILIMNDEKIEEDEDLKKHHEKSVDFVLRYSPTSTDAVTIAFDNSIGAPALAATSCERLGLDNIRLMKKIERIVLIVSQELREFDDAVLKQAVQTLTLLTACKYSESSENIPAYDFVCRDYNEYFDVLADKENKPEQEKKWSQTLSHYGFGHLDEFDHVLKDFLENGFLDRSLLNKYATQLDQQIKAQTSTNAFSEAWSLYHDTLENNEEKVVRTIVSSFKKNYENITPLNVNGTVMLLRELGHEEEADEIIQHYIDNVENPEVFDMHRYAFSGDITDKKLREAFDNKHKEISNDPDFNAAEALVTISQNDSWSSKQLDHLAAMSADDYIKLFKDNAGANLSRIIKTALMLGNVPDLNDPNYAKLGKVVNEALEAIAKESNINKHRMKRYGIVLDETPITPDTP